MAFRHSCADSAQGARSPTWPSTSIALSQHVDRDLDSPRCVGRLTEVLADLTGWDLQPFPWGIGIITALYTMAGGLALSRDTGPFHPAHPKVKPVASWHGPGVERPRPGVSP
jgi:hypothetical protein